MINPISKKDLWNSSRTTWTASSRVPKKPELAQLLPALYPNVFPNLAAYEADGRTSLAILHTGIPTGIVPGYQNYTGPMQATSSA